MRKFLPESINDLFTDFNEELPFKVYEIQKKYSKNDFFSDINKIKLDTVPGIRYRYSNVDTEIMAQVLENIYQESFNTILTNYFKTNVGMQNTYINLPNNKKQFLANGYGMTGRLVPHEVVLYGADGGVKTTMLDLVNYLGFQLDKNIPTVVESHRVLYHNKNREMAYYIPIKNHKNHGTYYKMHGGAFGSQNWLFILPKYHLGISVITNQSDLKTAEKLMKTVNGLIRDLK